LNGPSLPPKQKALSENGQAGKQRGLTVLKSPDPPSLKASGFAYHRLPFGGLLLPGVTPAAKFYYSHRLLIVKSKRALLENDSK